MCYFVWRYKNLFVSVHRKRPSLPPDRVARGLVLILDVLPILLDVLVVLPVLVPRADVTLVLQLIIGTAAIP